MLWRAALRTALGEHAPSTSERKFLDNIIKRVTQWPEVQPFYSDAKNGAPESTESRGTEAVLNALILARYDRPEAKDALRNMWELQLKAGEKRGSWPWLNFHNEPWESDDSAFWGAALAGVAVGLAPGDHRTGDEIQEGVTLLSEYLQREQRSQSTLNRAVALWASGKLPRLLTPDQRDNIVREILGKQREDGGWSASSLVRKEWKRSDSTPMSADSDGYGTGLMILALRQSGVAPTQVQIAKGLVWLERNQETAGSWRATSMNRQRDPASDAGQFMSDAATAYSVFALCAQ